MTLCLVTPQADMLVLDPLSVPKRQCLFGLRSFLFQLLAGRQTWPSPAVSAGARLTRRCLSHPTAEACTLACCEGAGRHELCIVTYIKFSCCPTSKRSHSKAYPSNTKSLTMYILAPNSLHPMSDGVVPIRQTVLLHNRIWKHKPY